MSGFAKTNWRETLHIRDHVPNVPLDHKHDIQFSLSVLSVVVDDHPVTNVTDEQGSCFYPFLSPFSFSFLLSEGKVRLYIGLYQLCTRFRVKIIVTCRQEEQLSKGRPFLAYD